jgi:hypothetical protein
MDRLINQIQEEILTAKEASELGNLQMSKINQLFIESNK